MFKKYVFYLMFSVLFVGCAMSGKVMISETLNTYDRNNGDVIIIGEIGEMIPEGYELIAKGNFKTGPLTVKCGKGTLDEQALKEARRIGADAVKYFDLKQPNYILNTCYKSGILFLKKKE